MCLSAPSAPTPQVAALPPTPPAAARTPREARSTRDTGGAASATNRAAALLGGSDRQSTLLGSAQGVLGAASTAQKTLLGR